MKLFRALPLFVFLAGCGGEVVPPPPPVTWSALNIPLPACTQSYGAGAVCTDGNITIDGTAVCGCGTSSCGPVSDAGAEVGCLP